MRTLLATLVALLPFAHGYAICTVSSANGYTVHLDVRPIAIEPNSDVCVNGYQYKVRMSYSISFTGTNIPSSLYTLQGTITCGSTSIFFNLPNNGGSGTVLSSNASTTRTDCTTATPASLSCNTVRIEINGPSLSNRTITCSFSPLPIELVSFEATPRNDAVELDWTTASERDNDHFTIERSADGVAFTDLQQVGAVGNSTGMQRYTATDIDPMNGVSYYRLRQTDFDGTRSWSPVVAIRMDPANSLSVFPNPATTSIRIDGDVSGRSLQIHSSAGILVHSTTLEDNHVILPELASGIYEFRVTDPRKDDRRHARVVIH
jgi:hypothetical protein